MGGVSINCAPGTSAVHIQQIGFVEIARLLNYRISDLDHWLLRFSLLSSPPPLSEIPDEEIYWYSRKRALS